MMVFNLYDAALYNKGPEVYRATMGYSWSKLVYENEGNCFSPVDYAKSIPGEDMVFSAENVALAKAKVMAEYGNVIFMDHEFGDTVPGKVVASFSRQWCGGGRMIAYLPTDPTAKQPPEDNGIEVSETAENGAEIKMSVKCGIYRGEPIYDFYAQVQKDGATADTRWIDFVYRLNPVTDQKMHKKGAVGRLGNQYLGAETWEAVERALEKIKSHIAECEEKNGIAAKKSEKKAKEDALNAKKSIEIKHLVESGYCFSCESYCHGDCGSYSSDPLLRFRREIALAQAEAMYGVSPDA